jgi:hypothetical protein
MASDEIQPSVARSRALSEWDAAKNELRLAALYARAGDPRRTALHLKRAKGYLALARRILAIG